jgi:hypothetical protein
MLPGWLRQTSDPTPPLPRLALTENHLWQKTKLFRFLPQMQERQIQAANLPVDKEPRR